MEQLVTYTNGNTRVTIYADGTKVREYSDSPVVMFPESMDVKITDYCDMGCAYCHENSTMHGAHADIDVLLDIIGELPSGVEIAIGGGNPLAHPRLILFLKRLKEMGIISNITINQSHIADYWEDIVRLVTENLVKGMGISITDVESGDIPLVLSISDNVVFHVIAGVADVTVLDVLSRYPQSKVLILGYKAFGRGIGYHSAVVDKNIKEWRISLREYIGRCVMAFDNLAIKQLNVRALFTDEGWKRFYMGDDFSFTMYLDAVRQEYAPTSCSEDRTPFSEMSLLQYFRK
jgi:hypothetical protein